MYQVVRNDQPSPCVSGTRFGSGALAVSNPRISQSAGKYPGTYRTVDWMESDDYWSNRYSMWNAFFDARIASSPRNVTYGVMEWKQPSGTVTDNGDVHAGTTSVADPVFMETMIGSSGSLSLRMVRAINHH